MNGRCTICGQMRDDCPTHAWPEMRRLLTGHHVYDLPGKTGDLLDGAGSAVVGEKP